MLVSELPFAFLDEICKSYNKIWMRSCYYEIVFHYTFYCKIFSAQIFDITNSVFGILLLSFDSTPRKEVLRYK